MKIRRLFKRSEPEQEVVSDDMVLYLGGKPIKRELTLTENSASGVVRKLNDIKNRESKKSEEWEEKIKRQLADVEDKRLAFNELRKRHLRQASIEDYESWLKGWLKDNDFTHYYDYEFGRQDFYVATSDFVLYPFYGAQSFNVIVPKGIRYTIEGRGHCCIYDLNDFTHIGGFVPGFSDIKL